MEKTNASPIWRNLKVQAEKNLKNDFFSITEQRCWNDVILYQARLFNLVYEEHWKYLNDIAMHHYNYESAMHYYLWRIDKEASFIGMYHDPKSLLIKFWLEKIQVRTPEFDLNELIESFHRLMTTAERFYIDKTLDFQKRKDHWIVYLVYQYCWTILTEKQHDITDSEYLLDFDKRTESFQHPIIQYHGE